MCSDSCEVKMLNMCMGGCSIEFVRLGPQFLKILYSVSNKLCPSPVCTCTHTALQMVAAYVNLRNLKAYPLSDIVRGKFIPIFIFDLGSHQEIIIHLPCIACSPFQNFALGLYFRNMV